MRLSMAKKIYLVIAILVFVAVAIACLGFYGATRLASAMVVLGQQANRTISLNVVDRIAMERRVLTTSIIESTDENEMRKLMDNDMRLLERDMSTEIDKYYEQFPKPVTPARQANVKAIRDLWDGYVKVTNEVADLSYENSNAKATRLNAGLKAFWDDIDTRIELLARHLSTPEVRMLNVFANKSRNDLLRFRMLVSEYIPESDAARMEELEKEASSLLQNIPVMLGEIEKEQAGLEGGSMAAAVREKIAKEGVGHFTEISRLVRQRSNIKAVQLLNTAGVEARTKLQDFVRDIIRRAMEGMDEEIANGRAVAKQVDYLIVIGSVAGIVVALILAYITVRSIITRLRRIIGNLGDSASRVDGAASQISTSSQDLADGSNQQASALEETSSALEEMSSMTRQNADNANKTNSTTQNNGRLIASGAEAVRNMSKAMSEISESAEQINRIIKTIEDIAFQTNLLALNAAVEAARAGEAGKGFAVVADEVRNLAGRSAQSARETTQLIQTTIERVQNGTEIASDLDASFKEIEEGSNMVARLITEITAATNEQAQGVDQVNTAVAQMDKVTQSNATTAAEAASAAQELSNQSSALTDMVDDLITMVEGGINGEQPRPQQQPAAVKARVAPAPARKPAATMRMLQASEVIPLDETDDF